MLVRQRLKLTPCSFLVAHHLVDAHLRQRDLLASALYVLDTVDGAQHAAIVLVLLIQLQENLQHIGATTLVAGQLFVDVLRLSIVAHTEEVLPESLLIEVVVGVQLRCPFQTDSCQRVFFEFTLVHRHIVPGFSRLRVDAEAVAEQVEGSIVVPGILLPHGLQKEVLVAERIGSLKPASSRNDKRSRSLVALLLCCLAAFLESIVAVRQRCRQTASDAADEGGAKHGATRTECRHHHESSNRVPYPTSQSLHKPLSLTSPPYVRSRLLHVPSRRVRPLR